MKIVFLDRDTISQGTTLRAPAFAHTWMQHDRTTAEQAAQRIRDAHIVIVNKVKLSAETLAQAPHLKLIAVAATGTDNIDLAACQQRGIVVSNVRNYAKHTVPEHTFALIFALRRSICAYHDAVKAGRWLRLAEHWACACCSRRTRAATGKGACTPRLKRCCTIRTSLRCTAR